MFGSVARGEDRPDSDVDLLADPHPASGCSDWAGCGAELEQILHARIDLVPAGDLKPSVAKRIAAELVAL